MKRLNRKGFTLVELLAVIVILAIVVGITLMTVLPTLKKSRQEAFKLTAQTAADYYEKQYQLYMIGEVTNFAPSGTVAFEAAGLKSGNYDQTDPNNNTYVIDPNTGRACVTLTRSTEGDYYDADENNGVATSSGCTN